MAQSISNSFRITKESFNEWYKKYYARLCRFAYYYVNTKDMAEEIVQDVFTGIWAKQHQIHISTSIESYLYIAVKNEAFSRLKKRVKTQTLEELPLTENEGKQHFDAVSFTQKLERVLDTLPEKCRLIYRLKFMEGLTNREISHYLDLSEKTVETQVYRALIKLRKQLAPHLTKFYSETT